MHIQHRLQIIGSSLLLFACVAQAVSRVAPWQVTNLYSFSPSGQPGASPNWYIRANISNPASAPESTVYCTSIWQYPDDPYNKFYDCEVIADTTDSADDASKWAWTLEPLEVVTKETHFATTNVDLRWRAAKMSGKDKSEGGGYEEKKKKVRILTGVAHFEIGVNMKGLCAASGFCQWNLDPKKTPVLVDVQALTCHGTVKKALHGIGCD